MRLLANTFSALLAFMLGAPLLLSASFAQEGERDTARGQTEHFSWATPKKELARTRPLTKTAEKELTAISKWLGLPSAPQGELIWVTKKEDLQLLLDFHAPSWFAAVTQPHENRIIMVIDAAYSQEQLHKTLRHELVHWAMQSLGRQQWASLPAWAHEGIAEVWAEQKLLGGMEVPLAWPAFRKELPSLGDFSQGFGTDPYRAAQGYALAHAFFARLQRIHGEDFVANLMAGIRGGETMDHMLIELTGFSLVTNEKLMKEELGSLSRLLSDVYPQMFLVMTLILLIGFPAAMRRRRKRHKEYEEKWAAQDAILHEESDDDDATLRAPS